MIELADNAYKLQMKAQKTAEEAMNHLKIYMAEQEGMVIEDTAVVHLSFFIIFFLGHVEK